MSLVTRRVRLAVASIAALASLVGCNLNISNQAEARNEWKKTFTLSPGGTLEIRNTNGLIDVTPSDGATIDITAERIVHAGTDQAAKDALAQMEIHEQVSSGRILLDSSSHLGGMQILFGGSREVKYHVHAPKATNVLLVTTNGTISVSDITGTFHAEATNGKIIGRALTGSASAETTNGEIDVEMAAVAEGGVTCTTTNGEIAVGIPHDSKARVSAQVTNGSIDTANLTLGDIQQSRRTLAATLNGGGPAIRLEATNGSIVLKGK